jgi:general stress protein 26
MHEEAIAKAAEIVEKACGSAGYATLAMIDVDGYPTAAAMYVSKAEGISWVTFCTGVESNWVARAERCDRASVCFNSPLYNITLVGSVEALTDPDVKRGMWYEGMGYYFDGPEDPRFCVLLFETRRYSIMLADESGTVRGMLEQDGESAFARPA